MHSSLPIASSNTQHNKQSSQSPPPPPELTNLNHYGRHLPHQIGCCQPSDPVTHTKPTTLWARICITAPPSPYPSATHFRKSLPHAFRNKLETHLAALTLDSYYFQECSHYRLECMKQNTICHVTLVFLCHLV